MSPNPKLAWPSPNPVKHKQSQGSFSFWVLVNHSQSKSGSTPQFPIPSLSSSQEFRRACAWFSLLLGNSLMTFTSETLFSSVFKA